MTQKELSHKLQRMGYDVDQFFIHRIENGQRFVTDIELVILAEALEVTILELLSEPEPKIYESGENNKNRN